MASVIAQTMSFKCIQTLVGGIGVLLGLFLPCGLLFFVLLSGHFRAETSGAKELYMAQLASMIVRS
jgi:hypothetical protein